MGPNDRTRLEQLCRYVLRPPLAEDRLRRLADGRVRVALKRAWSDGTTHLLFAPVEFLEKLAALTPRPEIGVEGPGSRGRPPRWCLMGRGGPSPCDSRPDDALIGGLTLTSDFNVTIDDPFGSAEAAFQAASNMQTTADPIFAPIGTSFEGLPLIYTLGFTFHPGSFATPDIGFGFNPSYEFFDPSDVTFSNPLSPGSLQSYVTNKITGALIPSGNSITLAGDLPLFVYRGTSVADVADLQLDQLQGVLVSTVVPQPASGALLCIGLTVAGLVAVRRSRA